VTSSVADRLLADDGGRDVRRTWRRPDDVGIRPRHRSRVWRGSGVRWGPRCRS